MLASLMRSEIDAAPTREAVRRDVDRERYLRLDSAAEAEQCKARLAALQRDLARMEEALRCMLQYKTRCLQLKQDKAALSAAYEARIQQCQTTISKLSQENETLKKQVKTLEAQQQGGGAVQQALLERLRALEADAEQQRRQYERCLDDVANQVVRALLSQKGLREEVGALQQRIRELETQNRALTALLVQQLQHGEHGEHGEHGDQDVKQIAAGELAALAASEEGHGDMVTLSKPRLRRPAGRYRPPPTCGPFGALSPFGSAGEQLADERVADQHAAAQAALLAAVANIDPALWLQVARPQSLHLAPSLEGAQESAATAVREDRETAVDSEGSTTDLSGSWQPERSERSHSPAEAVSASASSEAGGAAPDGGQDAHARVAAEVAVADDDQDGSSSPESSPESGNRDEGYSTMSSDVQVEARISETTTSASTSLPPLGHTELEDVKEEAEVAVEAVSEAKAAASVTAGGRLLLLDLQALSARHSFPPARDLQAVLRNSFSDSHLCLTRLLHHAAASLASTPASCPAAALASRAARAAPPALLADAAAGQHPLRRARATPSLLPPLQQVAEGEEDADLGADWWDADYVQHWLRLDETRSAMQQRHREALDLELEYDQAELEDWSLSFSCEDLDVSWRRQAPAPTSAPAAPLAEATPEQPLPSIQETNSLELEEDASECLWNNASYLEMGSVGAGGASRGYGDGGVLGSAPEAVAGWPYAAYALFNGAGCTLQAGTDAMMSSLAVNAAGSSPGGSWSSSAAASDCYDCCLNGCHGEEGSSKRSSAALSGCSDESAASAASAASRDRDPVGTDFTRDFYRLVKFESTKSLASNSSSRHSRGAGPAARGDNINNNNLPASMDREQALQSVLKFIAEQQKYCHSREEQDSANEVVSSRPVSLYDEPPPYAPYGPGGPGGSGPAEQPDSIEPLSLSSEADGAEGLQQQGAREPQPVQDEDKQDGEEAPREVAVSYLVRPCEERLRHESAASDVLVTSLDEVAGLAAPPTVPLETVLEDEELDTTPRGRRHAVEGEVEASRSVSVLVCDADDKAVSFHESATSKDVIDELNRMIRKGEGEACEEEAVTPGCLPARPRATAACDAAAASSAAGPACTAGAALSCPTGWVHVERDIDFTDPKARANLLDVMLASSASSGSISSSGSESGDGEDLPDGYSHLHRLHRFRRHKKVSAFREVLGALRLPSVGGRPSIIGRDDFFVRYGEKEREAISSFDFLDDMSSASISCASGAASGASSTLGSLQRLDAGSADARGATPTPQDGVDAAEDSDERTGGQLSLSDSCGQSLSGSRSSLEEDPPAAPTAPTAALSSAV